MNDKDQNYLDVQYDRSIREADAYFASGRPPAPAAPAPAPVPDAPANATGAFDQPPPIPAAAPAPAGTPDVAAAPDSAPAPAPTAAPSPSPAAAIKQPASLQTQTTPPPPATGVVSDEPSLVKTAPDPKARTFSEALSSLGREIGVGILEAPPQFVIGGRVDFIKNAFGLVQDLGSWIDTNMPWLGNADEAERQKGIQKMLDEKYGGASLDTIIPKPTTVIGNAARSIGAFMTGFSPMFKAIRAMGAGPFMASVASGAYAGVVSMAPSEEGLFNLLHNLPQPVADALSPLATNPDDSNLTNRARHALENAGMGVLTEGLIKGVQLFGAWRRAANTAAKEAASQTPEAANAAAQANESAAQLVNAARPAVSEQAPLFTMVEQPSTDAVVANKLQDVKMAVDPGVDATTLAKGIGTAGSIPELKLNYANITRDNIPDMAQQIGSSIIDRISDAKRGVMPNDVTEKIAGKLGMTPEQLIARPLGDAWNAEKIYGAAALLGQADADLRALAKTAAMANSTVADGFALRRQLTYYAAMQESFLGVAGEAGRALQIFKDIHSSGLLRQGQAIQGLIEKAGGMPNTRALAEIIANADEYSMSLVAKKGWGAIGGEAIRTVEVMNMLFRPATHIRNIVGNTGMLAQAATDLKYARMLGDFFGTPMDEAITQQGVDAYVAAHYFGLKDAFSSAGRSFAEGESQFGKTVAGGAATAVTDTPEALLAKSPPSVRYGASRGWSDTQIKQFSEGAYGKVIDYIGAGVTMPGRFLTAADDFYKTMIYGAKTAQNATDEAVRLGLTGTDFADHVASAIANPSDAIHLDASDWALWGTFNQTPGPITQGAMKIREAFGPAGTIVAPFLRTPGNIAAMVMEHTPLALLTKTFRADLQAGGVQRDLALAKMGTGSAMLATLISLAEGGVLMPTERIDPDVAKRLGGHITASGPNDPGLADAYAGLGVQKYAMRFGDKWYAISGMGQLAPPLAFAGDITEAWRTKDIRPQDYSRWGQVMSMAIASMYGSMENQSYFQGFAQMMHFLDQANRGNPGSAEQYLYSLAGQATIGAVPLSGAMTSTQKLWEPDTPSKKVMSYWQAIKAHTVGLSESVGPVRDRFGDIMPAGSWTADKPGGRWYDWFSPFSVTQFQHSPVREELVRLQSGLQRIPKKDAFDGVKVDFTDYPEVFDAYQRYAGNELKDPGTGLGFKDYMDGVISGDNPRLLGQHQFYQTLMDSQGEAHPGTKMAYIQSQASRFKEMAQNQIMAEVNHQPAEWQAFADMVKDEKQRVKTFETGRAGMTAPIENWGMKHLYQPPIDTQYTRPPKTNGSGGFTVPSQ